MEDANIQAKVKASGSTKSNSTIKTTCLVGPLKTELSTFSAAIKIRNKLSSAGISWEWLGISQDQMSFVKHSWVQIDGLWF